MKKELTDKLQ